MLDCPRCGTPLTNPQQPHVCDRLDAVERFNIPATFEERNEVSESVRELYNVPRDVWWKGREHCDPRRYTCGCVWSLPPKPTK
ncbi:MAG: hypothetical protein IT428_10895 [Planctomycetaceae bacterium]|nr:hypothetical protein [Planctomycetaceae bacterium]